jgi:hypothetical protein
MMGGQMGMYRIREDPVPVVEEEDEEEGDNSNEPQLQSGSKLPELDHACSTCHVGCHTIRLVMTALDRGKGSPGGYLEME